MGVLDYTKRDPAEEVLYFINLGIKSISFWSQNDINY